MVFLVGAPATGFVGLTSGPGFLFMALACLGGGGALLANGVSDILRERKSLPPR